MVDLNFIPETREPIINGDYCYIKLACGAVTFLDSSDYHLVASFNRWCLVGRKDSKARYAAHGNYPNKNIRLHNLILPCRDGLVVDHINGNGLDNRRSNLRLVTVLQNNMNRPPNKNSSSKYKGVSWNTASKKWCSRIKLNGKDTNFGFFDDQIVAAAIYDLKAVEYFGEYVWLNGQNFPEVLEFSNSNDVASFIKKVYGTK